MKIFLYPRLALDGIRKNARLYLPYIMTCVGMVVMRYIIDFLSFSESIREIRGGDIIASIMMLGAWVMTAFACLFLFYTNSFLIRRRKKEFGLYNILGMEKKNIARVLFWETAITAAISIGAGLFFGILLSKLAELGLRFVMKSEVSYDFSVPLGSVAKTAAIFLVIYLLIYLNTLRQLSFSQAVDLVKSESYGEKPPKGNAFVGLLGLVMLAAAYAIAVIVENPLSAIPAFFIAVLLVIGGTYLLMIAGSVIFCRMLQKNRRFYYTPKHFVSVSSMVYRMKRNGAGLASICILATMVLVMVSSTTSLYFGVNDTINGRYPREIDCIFDGVSEETMAPGGSALLQGVRDEIAGVLKENSCEAGDIIDYRYAYTAGMLDGDRVNVDPASADPLGMSLSISGLYEFFFVPLEEYNAIMGAREELSDGEALMYLPRAEYPYDTISFEHGREFAVKKIDWFTPPGVSTMSIVPSIFLIVPDVPSAVEGICDIANYYGGQMVDYHWFYAFDTGLDAKMQPDVRRAVNQKLKDLDGISASMVEGREEEKIYAYSINGGLFCLGIILSIVFLFATVLIIYYKQLSEGYEDRARFGIMKKVGMTDREIQRSVNSQLLTVFFLPLIPAGVHMLFAFPMICRLLKLLNYGNALVFAFATALSFLVFSAFYAAVYKITSNAYVKIVSGTEG